MTDNTTTWIRRVAAGAVLAAAPALIALGTAAASQASTDASNDTSNDPSYTTPSPNYSPVPTHPQQDWAQSSWHSRHQAEIQSWYP